MKTRSTAVEVCLHNALRRGQFSRRLALSLLAAILVIPSAALAQGSGSSLSGLITDNSQAVVPGAVVKARHLTTNVTSETQSDSAGYYRFPSLPIGEYEVTVDHAGFAQASSHVPIETAHATRQDFALAVSGQAQTVTVQATSMLSQDDAMIGTTVGRLATTPLSSRRCIFATGTISCAWFLEYK
jgi:hypothetical protein